MPRKYTQTINALMVNVLILCTICMIQKSNEEISKSYNRKDRM